MAARWRRLSPASEPVCSRTLLPNDRPIACASIGPAQCRKPRIPIRSACCSAISIFICSTKAAISNLAHCLGAQSMTIDGVSGVRFAVWAPNAARVARGRRFQLLGSPAPSDARAAWRRHLGTVRAAASRRARVTNTTSSARTATGCRWKADPVARQTETPPGTASVVPQPDRHRWQRSKHGWQQRGRAAGAGRADLDLRSASRVRGSSQISRPERPRFGISRSNRLVPYVAEMGFTHVELLPITEHPFGGSWGYQPLGLFAPSGRFGPPRRLRALR